VHRHTSSAPDHSRTKGPLRRRGRFARAPPGKAIGVEDVSVTYVPGAATAEVLLRHGRDHAEVVDTLMREIGLTHNEALLVCRRLALTEVEAKYP
jgi:hypothetical protein